MLFLEAILDFIDDGFEVRLRSSRADDEEVGEGGDPTEIEGDDVFGLFVGGDAGAELG